MYNVSNDYRQQFDYETRNPSLCEVSHMIENTANASLTFTVSAYNNPIRLNDFWVSDTRFATAEPYGLILDGSSYITKDSEPLPTSMWYSGKATENSFIEEHEIIDDVLVVKSKGYSIKNTYLDVNINAPSSLDLLTLFIDFGYNSISYPTQLVAQSFDFNNVPIETKSYTNDKSSMEVLFSRDIGRVKRIRITPMLMSLPHKIFTVQNVILGNITVFADDQIQNIEWVTNSKVLTTEIPQYDITAKLIDPERRFDPLNPNSLYGLVTEKQPLGLKFGYMLDSGVVEWVQCATYLLTGMAVVEGVAPKTVTLKASHPAVIESGDLQKHRPALVGDGAISSINSITQVMGDIGVMSSIDVDNILVYGNQKSNVAVEIKVKEYVQMMANACGLTWLCDRGINGTSTCSFKDLKKLTGSPVFQFNNSNLYAEPKVEGMKTADSISYTTYDWTLDGDSPKGDTQLIYNPSGLPPRQEAVLSTNPLISYNYPTSNQVRPFSDFAKVNYDYLAEPNKYILDNRGFPELDCGDIIEVKYNHYDTYGENIIDVTEITGIVVANRITYNGALKGETEVISFDNVNINYGGATRRKFKLILNQNCPPYRDIVQEYTQLEKATIISNPFIRSGYLFSGWNTSPNGEGFTYYDGQNIVLYKDLKLYAQWEIAEEMYKVTFMPNGSLSEPFVANSIKAVPYIIPKINYERSGYYLSSWNTKADGTGDTYKSGDVLLVTSNISLYAQWSRLLVMQIQYNSTVGINNIGLQEITNGYSCVIDWGDGNEENYIEDGGIVSHEYTNSGNKTISIFGDKFGALQTTFLSEQDKAKITSVVMTDRYQDVISTNSLEDMLAGCINLVGFNDHIPLNVTNLNDAFNGCSKLNKPITIHSGVTSVGGMFAYCSSLNQNITLPQTVDYALSCFVGCSKLSGRIKIYGNPYIGEMFDRPDPSFFEECSTDIGNNYLYVDYGKTTNINLMLFTKSENSRILKGNLLT